MIPIGKGQRELIVGDRQTGKTSLDIDTIINQQFQSVLRIYLPIGQKAASILEVYISLSLRNSTSFLVVVFSVLKIKLLFHCLGSECILYFLMILAD